MEVQFFQEAYNLLRGGETVKTCSKCKIEKPLIDFPIRDSKKGTRRADCKECHSSSMLGRYAEKRKFIDSYKEEQGCCKCGDKRHYVLDLHHVDPSIKDKNVSRMVTNKSSIESIKKEISKCVVLCSNCHREYHYLESINSITLKEYIEG